MFEMHMNLKNKNIMYYVMQLYIKLVSLFQNTVKDVIIVGL